MLTKEENDFLTQIGPGTPAGQWIRRFWQPIMPAGELTDENPTRYVRVLGEDLVLFKDRSDNVGLIQHRCPHRGASLLYGRVEERGLSCAYHGWLYDTEGNCLEQPAEPEGSTLYEKVHPVTYPVRRFIGLYWTYMGPQPAPEIPHYKAWLERDSKIRVTVYPKLDCNWLVAVENALDPAHLQFLHQDSGPGMVPINTTRGNMADVESFDFYETPYGVMKQRIWKNGTVDEHAFNWPTYLTTGWLRTPIDDQHTMVFIVSEGGNWGGGQDPSWGNGRNREGPQTADGAPQREGRGRNGGGGGGYGGGEGTIRVEQEDAIIEYLPPLKTPAGGLYPDATLYFYAPFGQIAAQDHLIWETQGVINDRSIETLGTSDKGIILVRKLLKENIMKVIEGRGDPTGIVRDTAIIDPTLGKHRNSGIPVEDRVTPLAPREEIVPKGRLEQWMPPKRATNGNGAERLEAPMPIATDR